MTECHSDCVHAARCSYSLWNHVQDVDRKGLDLSALSYADAVEYLRQHATILDYSTLNRKESHALNSASPGIVPGVRNLFAPFLLFFISFIFARVLVCHMNALSCDGYADHGEEYEGGDG